MKVITRCIIFTFSIFLTLAACGNQEKAIHVYIYIIDNSSKIELNFSNDSDSNFYLSEYNFCKDGVIFQDLFKVIKVENNDKKHEASYAGTIDFVSNTIPKNKFLLLKPTEKLSCIVDIGRYYLTLESGKYEVKYIFINPSIENQKAIELQSNKIEINLTASKPINK